MEPDVLLTAKAVALSVTNQPHYWRGHPETLQVSKTDLETDIAYEVAKLIRRLMGLVSGT
jgi:hypothetical protein